MTTASSRSPVLLRSAAAVLTDQAARATGERAEAFALKAADLVWRAMQIELVVARRGTATAAPAGD